MKEWVKRLARLLLGDYSVYCIYRCAARQPVPATAQVIELDATAIAACTSALMREQAGYAGPGSRAFGVQEEGNVLALCFYWHGERYKKRNFWPLRAGEAKLVQIVTAEEARGRGLARMLIAHSADCLVRDGFTALYARIWHSNLPSVRAFEAAGWERIALVVEVNPLRRARPWRLKRALHSRG